MNGEIHGSMCFTSHPFDQTIIKCMVKICQMCAYLHGNTLKVGALGPLSDRVWIDQSLAIWPLHYSVGPLGLALVCIC
jgi:hypothetical protein